MWDSTDPPSQAGPGYECLERVSCSRPSAHGCGDEFRPLAGTQHWGYIKAARSRMSRPRRLPHAPHACAARCWRVNINDVTNQDTLRGRWKSIFYLPRAPSPPGAMECGAARGLEAFALAQPLSIAAPERIRPTMPRRAQALFAATVRAWRQIVLHWRTGHDHTAFTYHRANRQYADRDGQQRARAELKPQ